MPTKRSARVVLNRKAVDGVYLAIADGMLEVGKAMLLAADPPDETPFGEGLVDHGGVLVYVGEKKVGGWGLDGKQPKKPRAFRVKGTTIIQAAIGWSFPARFQELGTLHQPARPFFTPAVNRVLPRVPSIMRQATAYRLARLRSIGRA